MEARIARLESDVNHIRSDIADIKSDTRDFRSETNVNLRLLLGTGIAAAMGLMTVMAKGFGWL